MALRAQTIKAVDVHIRLFDVDAIFADSHARPKVKFDLSQQSIQWDPGIESLVARKPPRHPRTGQKGKGGPAHTHLQIHSCAEGKRQKTIQIVNMTGFCPIGSIFGFYVAYKLKRGRTSAEVQLVSTNAPYATQRKQLNAPPGCRGRLAFIVHGL